jgi:hypothetical protein
MKSWRKTPDNILLDSVKMTALMSFCFGVGLLASSIIGIGAKTQLAETTSFSGEATYTTSTTSGVSGSTSGGDTQTSTTASSSNTTTSVASGTSGFDTYSSPSLTFTSAVPSVVASDFTVTLNVVSIYRPQLVVRGLNVNKLIVLDPVSKQLTTVNFLVRFDQLPVGRYELIAKGTLTSNSTTIEVVGPKFEILAPVISKDTSSDSGQSSSTAIITTSWTTSATSTATNTTDTTLNDTEKIVEVEVPEVDLLIPYQVSYAGFVPVQVHTSASAPEVYIYLKSPNLSAPRFVGKARYYNNSTLLLMVDTNQLPNGEHRIYAVAKLADVNVESEKRRFVIDNSTTTVAILNPTVSSTTQPTTIIKPVVEPKPVATEPINLPSEPIAVPPKIQPKVINDTATSSNSESSETVVNSNPKPKPAILSDQLKSLIPLVLKEHEQEINQRLRSFGDDLQQTKEADVSKLRKEVEDSLMSILLDDYRLRSISAEAKKRLRTEVENLVHRAEKVELLLKKSEVTNESLDDLAKTLKSTEDALVDSTSPREFGLVREDMLQIESVSPIISIDTESTSTKVYTEIRGRAVPKSLVTLYIYSTPIMVTVRADADGTFVYVYEKDLDDGDHEVYVALTTTEGDVVVKSPVFQFIREAQAFNSPDSGNGDSLVPATAGTPITKNPYFIVISITLLIVSFVFFLLGFKSNRKPDEFTVV